MPRRATQRDDRGLRGGWTRFQQYRYMEPGADLAPFVAHYWAATWDLRGEPPYRQLIVPYPNVHLSFLNGVARVRGVARGHVIRVLRDQGWVFGVAFRPGCFRPFLGSPVSAITDRSLAVRDVFGSGVPERAMAGADDETEMAAIAERFLRAKLPAQDPMAETVAGIVQRVAAEPAITRVDCLAESVDIGMRRLQRLFAEYVGVGPKWVIRRYRLDEATKRMAAGTAVDWAGLAAELGYADQAHFHPRFHRHGRRNPSAVRATLPADLSGESWLHLRTSFSADARARERFGVTVVGSRRLILAGRYGKAWRSLLPLAVGAHLVSDSADIHVTPAARADPGGIVECPSAVIVSARLQALPVAFRFCGCHDGETLHPAHQVVHAVWIYL